MQVTHSMGRDEVRNGRCGRVTRELQGFRWVMIIRGKVAKNKTRFREEELLVLTVHLSFNLNLLL